MRASVLLLLSAALLAEDAEPVDLGKALRESEEFRKECASYRVTFEPGLVTAVGEIVYRGGGPCEYLVGVWPSKPHETVVLLDDGPFEGEGRRPQSYVEGLATTLHKAMLAAGFEKGEPFTWDRESGEVFPPKGPTVHLYCEWKDAEGKEHRARMADWLWNFKRVQVMEPGLFVYTGSMVYDEGPPTHTKWLGAEMDGLVVAVLGTQSALVDHTEDGGMDNGAYEAIAIRIPEIGTRAKVLFSAKPLAHREYEPLKLTPEIVEARKKREAEERKAAEEKK